MPPRPPPAPNIRIFKLSQRANPPHEKSPHDLSTSTIKSKSTVTNAVEELNILKPKQPETQDSNIKQSVLSAAQNDRFNELKGESTTPCIQDYLPPPQEGPSFSMGASYIYLKSWSFLNILPKIKLFSFHRLHRYASCFMY